MAGVLLGKRLLGTATQVAPDVAVVFVIGLADAGGVHGKSQQCPQHLRRACFGIGLHQQHRQARVNRIQRRMSGLTAHPWPGVVHMRQQRTVAGQPPHGQRARRHPGRLPGLVGLPQGRRDLLAQKLQIIRVKATAV